MEYSAATVRNWKKWIDHGDIKEIALRNKKNRDTISDALNNGVGSLETALQINAFVNEKKLALKNAESNK